MKRYHVYCDDWSCEITYESTISCDLSNCHGQFDTFSEAKAYAISRMKGKITCYEQDISTCKENINYLRSLKASNIKE